MPEDFRGFWVCFQYDEHFGYHSLSCLACRWDFLLPEAYLTWSSALRLNSRQIKRRLYYSGIFGFLFDWFILLSDFWETTTPAIDWYSVSCVCHCDRIGYRGCSLSFVFLQFLSLHVVFISNKDEPFYTFLEVLMSNCKITPYELWCYWSKIYFHLLLPSHYVFFENFCSVECLGRSVLLLSSWIFKMTLHLLFMNDNTFVIPWILCSQCGFFKFPSFIHASVWNDGSNMDCCDIRSYILLIYSSRANSCIHSDMFERNATY